jgi:hypothetical protein
MKDEPLIGLAPVLPILSRMRLIEGWLDDEEADLLILTASLALLTLPGHAAVVELGSYCGRSTPHLRPQANGRPADPAGSDAMRIASGGGSSPAVRRGSHRVAATYAWGRQRRWRPRWRGRLIAGLLVRWGDQRQSHAASTWRRSSDLYKSALDLSDMSDAMNDKQRINGPSVCDRPQARRL